MDTFRFCQDDHNSPVEIIVMKFFESGKHRVISKGYVTLMQFIESSGNITIKLEKNAGTIQLTKTDIRDRITFLDYVMGGTEIGVHVAIDYTMSNGDIRNPSSLHYLNPSTRTNQYTDALHEVVSIL